MVEEEFELKPTPILKGKVAERFYRDISTTEITEEQQEFINRCVEVYKELKEK